MAKSKLSINIITRPKTRCENKIGKNDGFISSTFICAITKKTAAYIVIILISVIVLSFGGCKRKTQKTSFLPAGPVTNEEYSIYSDLLVQLDEGYLNKNSILIVMRDLTRLGIAPISGKDLKSVKASLKKEFGDAINNDLIESFIGANIESQKLENKFDNSLNIVLLSKEKKAEIFGTVGNRWTKFYSEYPKPSVIIELSRVAFNKDRTKALVYYGSQFDSGKGGIGYYILLKKGDSNWNIVKKIKAWIA